MRDPYEVLGIQRGATDDEIKKAYRAKCKRWHPDLNPNDPTAEEHFKEVQAAYDAITKGDTGPQMGGQPGGDIKKGKQLNFLRVSCGKLERRRSFVRSGETETSLFSKNANL